MLMNLAGGRGPVKLSPPWRDPAYDPSDRYFNAAWAVGIGIWLLGLGVLVLWG